MWILRPMLGDITASYYTNDGDDGPVILKEGKFDRVTLLNCSCLNCIFC